MMVVPGCMTGRDQLLPSALLTIVSAPVLILSPHPDDEAIGMGGTLCKHLDNGSDVTVLYLTDGDAHLTHTANEARHGLIAL